MKNKKLLFAASLLSVVSLAGCTVEEFCGTNTNPPIETTPSEGDGGTTAPTVETDIFANVIPGLDRSEDNKGIHTFQKIEGVAGQEGSTQTYSGAVAGYFDGKNVAYGWAEYTVKEWYSTYGVAVKVTFSDDGKALSLQIGAPSEGAHNFTPMYADQNIDLYLNYLDNFEKKFRDHIVNKELTADLVKGASIDLTKGENGEYYSIDGVVSAKETQSYARASVALANLVNEILK